MNERKNHFLTQMKKVFRFALFALCMSSNESLIVSILLENEK